MSAIASPIFAKPPAAGPRSPGPAKPGAARHRALSARSIRQARESWISAQGLNVTRHAAALRPFRKDEFGVGGASPTDSHIQVVNDLIGKLRTRLLAISDRVRDAGRLGNSDPSTVNLQRVVRLKENAHNWVQAIEKIWDFYFELFGQRQSQYADWLLSCDRIALDCYQYAYLGCGKARSIPAPPPFCYMRTGFGPATYRRGISLTKLGKQINPFPLIQLPYHRLVNPWTLGAVLHEVSHNLQADLGLNLAIPKQIALRLLKAGLPRSVAMTWARWNRETFADMSGLLLGGPPFVGSLMDVLGRSPDSAMGFVPNKPHPTPYIRTFISCELLRRLGFQDEARRYDLMWRKIYPSTRGSSIPRAMLATMNHAIPIVVDAICYTPFESLGHKPLAQVIRFEPKEYQMMEEAAGRIAAGNDPGVVPARFLIGATRIALDRKLARPGVITANFYNELSRR